MEKEVVPHFGWPKMVVSNSKGCFTAESLVRFMRQQTTDWKQVSTYAPMFHWKAVPIVITMKKAIRLLVEEDPAKRAESSEVAVAGYRLLSLASWRSLFELMYVVRPNVVGIDGSGPTISEEARSVEILAIEGARASTAVGKRERDGKAKVTPPYHVRERVLDAHGKAFGSTVKCSA